MTPKQKISLAAASFLPMLALSVYLLLTPTRAAAITCPGGWFVDPYNGGCGTGSGGIVHYGSYGTFVFCNGQFGGHPGPGYCASPGCVKCTYGP